MGADASSELESPRLRRKSRLGTLLAWIVIIVLAVLVYQLYQDNQNLRNPERQIARIVEDISEHIILPADEVPGVFPINKETNTEPFFKNAETGDLLVVYRSTNQALIWSPNRNILVNAGVLVVDPGQEQVPPPTPAATNTDEAEEE